MLAPPARCGDFSAAARWSEVDTETERTMRSILMYLIGIPIPIILLLALCTHHF
jgi:hypothetical protein